MKPLILFLMFLSPILAIAQRADTIHVGTPFRHYPLLEVGTYRVLTSTQMNGKTVHAVQTAIEVAEVQRGGATYLSVSHHWGTPTAEGSGSFEFLCEPHTLKPVQHIRKSAKKGVEAYLFTDKAVTALDTATGNTLSGFKQVLNMPAFNWEIDLTTYAALPMQEGFEAVMPFYHPGGSPPAYYHIKVEGQEALSLPDGKTLDCWVLFTDYGGRQPTRFWYTKGLQRFVKMEGQYRQLAIQKNRLFD